MENQHRKITGYRDLSQEEIDDMNAIKELATQVGELVEDFAAKGPHLFDQRWVSIARTNLQQGFMALTRAVAKPDSF